MSHIGWTFLLYAVTGGLLVWLGRRIEGQATKFTRQNIAIAFFAGLFAAIPVAYMIGYFVGYFTSPDLF